MGLAVTDAFLPVYVRTTGSTANRTDVYAVAVRSLVPVPLASHALPQSLAIQAAPDAATSARVSENITRYMEKRIPGWSQWRKATRRSHALATLQVQLHR